MKTEGKVKRRILIDFDGTLSSYKTPFDPEAPEHLPDSPLPGAIAFLRRIVASSQYEAVIFTTRAWDRNTDDENLKVHRAIREWLARHGLEVPAAKAMQVTCVKLPCALIIDDNAFRFEGKYPDPEQMARLTTSRRPK